ncbi:hypothetical protein ACHAXR_001507, partial [Thalassiosira sp. AJA248-18]
IKFPSTVTEVGDYAFNGCTNLRDVVLNEGLQRIGAAAFRDCRSLDTIKFPSTVTEIGDVAFRACIILRYVLLNEGLRKIGSSAFCGCRSLDDIKFPSSVREIGNCAFYSCSDLRDVLFTKGVQTIGVRAFDACESLDNIKFPCISRRMEALNQNGQQAMENKINAIPGVEWIGGEILISLESVAGGENWETTRESLDQILGLIVYYELKEATTSFELALWKARISEETPSIDVRDDCRIGVPGPVKDAVLCFFSYNLD